MTRAGKAIRYSTIAAVVIVAGVAASFSYQHALDVVGHYSRPSRLNAVFPLTVDGLIYCGSMVLLSDARRGLAAHKLAYWMLGIGIAATLTVNAVSGLAYGLVGAVIAGWPAVALVLSYEGLMLIVRRSTGSAAEPADAPRIASAPLVLAQPAPADSVRAAQLALAASVAAGNPISQRQMMARFGLSRAAERKVRQAVLAGSNGHG